MNSRNEAKYNSVDFEFFPSLVLPKVFKGLKNDYFVS